MSSRVRVVHVSDGSSKQSRPSCGCGIGQHMRWIPYAVLSSPDILKDENSTSRLGPQPPSRHGIPTEIAHTAATDVFPLQLTGARCSTITWILCPGLGSGGGTPAPLESSKQMLRCSGSMRAKSSIPQLQCQRATGRRHPPSRSLIWYGTPFTVTIALGVQAQGTSTSCLARLSVFPGS